MLRNARGNTQARQEQCRRAAAWRPDAPRKGAALRSRGEALSLRCSLCVCVCVSGGAHVVPQLPRAHPSQHKLPPVQAGRGEGRSSHAEIPVFSKDRERSTERDAAWAGLQGKKGKKVPCLKCYEYLVVANAFPSKRPRFCRGIGSNQAHECWEEICLGG